MFIFPSLMLMAVQNLLPKQCKYVETPAAKAMLAKIDSNNVKISAEFATKPVESTYAFYKKESDSQSNNSGRVSIASNFFKSASSNNNPPYVLLHGFDSSCLEFRNLAPLLASNADVYVPDILGWGFNDHSGVTSFTPEAKVDHLKNFLQQTVKRPCILVGASLGGAVAIKVAAENPQLVKNLILIDAQGFIEGVKSDAPDSVAKIGIQILKAWPLRIFAGYLSYKNKKLSTFDATRIGRLHCNLPDWERASVNFLQSGGFKVTNLISIIKQKTLVIWGKNDEILEVKTAYQFQETLPSNEVVIIDECGHVPHIEKPVETANAIFRFLSVNQLVSV